MPGRSLRERREKKEKFELRHTVWTLKEKRLLLNAIKKMSPINIDSLHDVIKTKTKEEIQLYIEKIKKGAVRKVRAHKTTRAPIEHWLNLLSSLTDQEKKDYTQGLGQVVSIIANFEKHPTPGPCVPDYKAIYKYIAAMLSEKELPDLGKLECAVILDLLHGLVDYLRTHNTAEQRQVMQWKFLLLGDKVDMTDPASALVKARKAIENDFSDFTEQDSNIEKKKDQSTTGLDTNPQPCSSKMPQSQTDTSTAQSTSQQEMSTHPSVTNASNQSTDSMDKPGPSSSQPNNAENSSQPNGAEKTDSFSIQQSRRRGRPRTTTRTSLLEYSCPKKPTLFTMNPLCIPVHLIKLQPILDMSIKDLQNIIAPELQNTITLIEKHKDDDSFAHVDKQRRQIYKNPKNNTPITDVYLVKPHPDAVVINHDVPSMSKTKGKSNTRHQLSKK